MDQNNRKAAWKQYLHYFRFWFIALLVLLVFFGIFSLIKYLSSGNARGNLQAPSQRVYDYADVLTEEEEKKLSDLIAKREAQIQCDIVLVTINESVESSSVRWELAMRNYADDFYDNNNFGYDSVHGDGVLLLDNWYEGQEGSWLSTCGAVMRRFGNAEIDQVLDKVYRKVEQNPYEAYKEYVESVYRLMGLGSFAAFPVWLIFLAPVVVLVIFIPVKLRSRLGAERLGVNTYVAGGAPEFRAREDRFVRKFVTTRRIPRNNGGGGGGGGGGGHRSSGGVSHGGGGRRR